MASPDVAVIRFKIWTQPWSVDVHFASGIAQMQGLSRSVLRSMNLSFPDLDWKPQPF